MEDYRKERPSGESQGNRDGGGETAPSLEPYVQPQDDSMWMRDRRPRVDPVDPNLNQVVSPLLIYPRVLVNVARSLIDQGQFSIAVVVAHMASEVATEQRLSQSFTTKGLKYLQEPVTDFFNGYSLHNNRNRNLYVALTSDEVHKAAFRQKFKESATRRNKIM